MCGRFDGTTLSLTDMTTTKEVALSGSVNAINAPIFLMQDGYGSLLNGNLYKAAIYKAALNHMQVIDLNLRMTEDKEV